MRKMLLSIISVFVIILLVSCGSESTPEEPSSNDKPNETVSQNEQTSPVEPVVEVEPLDLTGTWVHEDSAEGSTYMAAVINDDSIGVFFIVDGDTFTYWVGTYEAPSSDDDSYSWVSKNTYTGNGILSSSAETKEFNYKNGQLSYELTFQGKTGTISLIRGEWDVTTIPDSAFENSGGASQEEPQPSFEALVVEDSGWFVRNEKYLYFYVDLFNPNKETVVELPSVRITARDADGILLGTEDIVLSVIYPEQHFVYGFQAFAVDEIPETVTFEPLEPKEYNLKKLGAVEEFVPLEVVNCGVRSSKIVGEIYNPNDYDIDDAIIVAICRNNNGNIVEIASGFVEAVKAGANTPFSVSTHSNEEITDIDYYANRWG